MMRFFVVIVIQAVLLVPRACKGAVAVAQLSVVACATALVITVAVTPAQTMTFVPVGSVAITADMIEVQGSYAYVAADATLRVIDISNPAVPQVRGAYTFPERI